LIRRKNIAKPKLVLSLAKVLIAAAWADGKISHDEINSLKDLLFQMPEMKARDWAKLDIYIDAPVSETERERLVEELKEALSSPADRELAAAKLKQMVEADGSVTETERALLEELESEIRSADVSILGKLGRLVRGPMRRRSETFSEMPSREHFIEDFIRNRIYYSVRRRLNLEATDLHISQDELRKLGLAGGLMARVAFVNRLVEKEEIEAMIEALRAGWKLPQKEAALVAEVAVAEVGRDLDFYRLARQFFESTTEEERVRFLDVLFAVANADGAVSNTEIEEIRSISNLLKLTHRQFIEAKLKVPRERRADQ
jgi:uncharacterized tellurite resistance protein B-like protein